MPELSVLIVNYNTWRECAEAIRTLREHGPTRPDGSPMPFECIVVDNDSPRKAPELIAGVEQELAALREQQGDERAGQLIRHDQNSGYSKGMNLAFAHSRGQWILVSNPDLIFGEGLLPSLQRHLEQHPNVGIAVPKGFWDEDFAGHLPPNTLPTLGDAWVEAFSQYSAWLRRRHARKLVQAWQRAWNAEQPLDLPMMSGCMFLIDRSFFERIGKFDERYPLYYEDADLSVTIRRAGRTVTQVPDARLVHFVNRSGMSDLKTMWERHHESRSKYYRKWYGLRGRLTLAVTRWLVNVKWLERFRRFVPDEPFVDLGEQFDRPVLELPRSCERFLVLMSLDSRFFLSAGIYGSGDRWSPSDNAFAMFVNANFFFCVFDVSGGKLERLGMWRYYCLTHLGQPVRPRPEPAPTGAGPASEAVP